MFQVRCLAGERHSFLVSDLLTVFRHIVIAELAENILLLWRQTFQVFVNPRDSDPFTPDSDRYTQKVRLGIELSAPTS